MVIEEILTLDALGHRKLHENNNLCIWHNTLAVYAKERMLENMDNPRNYS